MQYSEETGPIRTSLSYIHMHIMYIISTKKQGFGGTETFISDMALEDFLNPSVPQLSYLKSGNNTYCTEIV